MSATATGAQIHVYAEPGAPTPVTTLPNPWLLNDDPKIPVPQVFLVQQLRPDGWVQVLLPQRPNGSQGWIPASELALSETSYRVRVSLRAHELTVADGEKRVYQGSVAIGTSQTPTPPGTYYIRVLLQSQDPSSVYGPYAYGLSAHSEALTEFDGGDAEVGIHGNNDASVLGKSVTHGCVRMDNSEITALAKTLPLGTPVQIEG